MRGRGEGGRGRAGESEGGRESGRQRERAREAHDLLSPDKSMHVFFATPISSTFHKFLTKLRIWLRHFSRILSHFPSLFSISATLS